MVKSEDDILFLKRNFDMIRKISGIKQFLSFNPNCSAFENTKSNLLYFQTDDNMLVFNTKTFQLVSVYTRIYVFFSLMTNCFNYNAKGASIFLEKIIYRFSDFLHLVSTDSTSIKGLFQISKNKIIVCTEKQMFTFEIS